MQYIIKLAKQYQTLYWYYQLLTVVKLALFLIVRISGSNRNSLPPYNLSRVVTKPCKKWL